MATEDTLSLMLKDVGEVHARLFDHRPVIQLEVNYHLAEFEEKRQDRESERMKKMEEYNKDSIERLIPDSIELMEKHLQDLNTKVKATTEICQRISSKEEQLVKTNPLEGKREARMSEWANFMDNMCDRSHAVDGEFEAEVLTIKNEYENMQKKLKIVPHIG